MKINFKTLLIIFLVAMLGSAAGVFSILQIKDAKAYRSSEPVFTQVSYTNSQNSSYTDAINKAYDTVVVVSCNVVNTSYSIFGSSTQEATSLGSGVIISSDGYIVTNHHVIENATKVTVKLSNQQEYEAQIVASDNRCDLAVLKIEENDLPYSLLADSDQLNLGQEVIAIGNPLGSGVTCSQGIVSAINKEISIDNYKMTLIQTDAAINEGNSGGGLFNLNGDLVGIVNSKSSSSYYLSTVTIEGMGYAIPSNTVANITNDLIEYGYVKNRATLGVKVLSDANAYLYYNINGLMITDVIEGGAAEKAGLMANDIIKEIDGKQILNYADLSNVLNKLNIGDTVKILIERDGAEKEFKVTLQEATSN